MPFTACIKCEKLGNGCDGPNFFSLPATDVLEWCKTRKSELRLSNARLAELSGIPKGTIDYVFGTSRVDFKFETMRPIIRVLVGGEFHGNPCPDPNGDMAAKIVECEKNIESLHRRLKANREEYHADLERERSDSDRRANYLKHQLRVRMIFIIVLSVLLTITLAVIISALLIDRASPDKGFFWLEYLGAAVQQIASNRLFSLLNRFM